MQKLLRAAKKDKETGKLFAASVKACDREYDAIIRLGYNQQKERSSPKALSYPKAICLLNRLKHYKTQILLLMHRKDFPFDIIIKRKETFA